MKVCSCKYVMEYLCIICQKQFCDKCNVLIKHVEGQNCICIDHRKGEVFYKKEGGVFKTLLYKDHYGRGFEFSDLKRDLNEFKLD